MCPSTSSLLAIIGSKLDSDLNDILVDSGTTASITSCLDNFVEPSTKKTIHIKGFNGKTRLKKRRKTFPKRTSKKNRIGRSPPNTQSQRQRRGGRNRQRQCQEEQPSTAELSKKLS
jgi:hypothetical protein